MSRYLARTVGFEVTLLDRRRPRGVTRWSRGQRSMIGVDIAEEGWRWSKRSC